jgi:hypothetical protein
LESGRCPAAAVDQQRFELPEPRDRLWRRRSAFDGEVERQLANARAATTA